ncbi:MAG TPA: putative toxin-antitoxin system toxin component, PIN family [Acidiferrobacterales bacterium]|nr:putative toxin-antitoxin system toxin component, PIN family [Acidiferrobacterales bacterium]
MRVVLDTGILIAALITADTSPDQVYQAWRKKRFTLVTSVWQLGEFRRASRYERVKKFLKPTEAGNLVNGLKRHATVLTELPDVDLSRDPQDNPVLAMAIAGEADYLVTGDRRGLLSLKRVGATRIVTAAEFLKILKKKR